MLVVSLVKFLGLALLAGLWLFLYRREHEWWLLGLFCLGLMAAIVQLLPFSRWHRDEIAGAYIGIVFFSVIMLRVLRYRPKHPLKMK